MSAAWIAGKHPPARTLYRKILPYKPIFRYEALQTRTLGTKWLAVDGRAAIRENIPMLGKKMSLPKTCRERGSAARQGWSAWSANVLQNKLSRFAATFMEVALSTEALLLLAGMWSRFCTALERSSAQEGCPACSKKRCQPKKAMSRSAAALCSACFVYTR